MAGRRFSLLGRKVAPGTVPVFFFCVGFGKISPPPVFFSFLNFLDFRWPRKKKRKISVCKFKMGNGMRVWGSGAGAVHQNDLHVSPVCVCVLVFGLCSLFFLLAVWVGIRRCAGARPSHIKIEIRGHDSVYHSWAVAKGRGVAGGALRVRRGAGNGAKQMVFFFFFFFCPRKKSDAFFEILLCVVFNFTIVLQACIYN